MMRHRFISLVAIMLISGKLGMETQAQTINVDPALTAAIVEQTLEYKSLHKKRNRLQEQIIASEAAVTLALDRVHGVEEKMLEYLSNAQGVMTNLYQVKRAAELVGVDIPNNLIELGKSVPSHLKGTAIAAIVSDEIKDVTEQMTSLYPFVAQLVTSGSYNVTDNEGKTQKHKVNLLSSAERYYVANEIVRRLERINIDIYILAWQVKTMSWNNLWYSLDPDGWASVMSGKAIVDVLIRQWNHL